MQHLDDEPNYGRSRPGMFAVVLTSILTSLLTTVLLLFVTGNLSLSMIKESNKLHAVSRNRVPSLIGLPSESAKDVLTASGLRMVARSERPDKLVAKGSVIEQTPLPDSELKQNGEVEVVISSGPPDIAVPAVLGKPVEEAKNLIEAAELKIGEVTYTGSGEPGVVTEATPKPGTIVQTAATVTLIAVPEAVEVPKVIGLRRTAAGEKLEAVGLKVGDIRWVYNEYRSANIVLRQDPEPEAKVAPGTAVKLFLNEE